MIKNSFLTLTVSLLVFGLLSIVQPQTTYNNPTVDQSQPKVITKVKIEETEFLYTPFLVLPKTEVEVEEIEQEVKVETPKVKTSKPAPVVQTTKKAVEPAKKETAKVEASKAAAPKREAPQEEVKVETQPPVETTAPQPQPEPQPEPKVEAVAVSTQVAETWELEVVRLTNIERQNAGLPILKYNNNLQQGANIRAQEIITSFSHTRPDGSRFFTAFGNLQYRNIGENLASGYRSPEAVVNAWMNSEGHRANILKPEYQEITVAITQGDDGKYRWVQIFYRGR